MLYNDFQVKHVMNITDVGHLTGDRDMGEDKMEKGALREGRSAWEIAEFFTQAFKSDIAQTEYHRAGYLGQSNRYD